jgi:hypothetical protein
MDAFQKNRRESGYTGRQGVATLWVKECGSLDKVAQEEMGDRVGVSR